MTYKWLRGLILWVPTAVIGFWEYVRHAFLLPYVSMELGNWLAPVIVFVVTLTLLRPLFGKLESMQEELKREQVGKAALEEREQLAKELHDGISQSLFMLSVKLDSLDSAQSKEETSRTMEGIRGTVRHVYDNVRQSIASLQEPPTPADTAAWLQSVQGLADEMERTSGTVTTVEWGIPDGWFSHKEKVELLAIMREALMNIRKHAGAGWALIRASVEREDGPSAAFRCVVEDDGTGFLPEELSAKGKYGVKMMRERAAVMGWNLHVGQAEPNGTIIVIEGRCKSS